MFGLRRVTALGRETHTAALRLLDWRRAGQCTFGSSAPARSQRITRCCGTWGLHQLDPTMAEDGDARWPFAGHPATEMAVCQAPGQRDGRLPGARPAQRARNLAKVGWAAAQLTRGWGASGAGSPGNRCDQNHKIVKLDVYEYALLPPRRPRARDATRAPRSARPRRRAPAGAVPRRARPVTLERSLVLAAANGEVPHQSTQSLALGLGTSACGS
eukprot:COSAG02_NODE_813_length_16901_cov_45.562135_1_plen_215_part_00